MNKSLLGLPLILWGFALIIIMPTLIGEVLLYHNQKSGIPCTNNVLVREVIVTPTASPSATITSAPTKKLLKVATPTGEISIAPSK